jgi:diguanylate cyclase (GGDEF)-like protein
VTTRDIRSELEYLSAQVLVIDDSSLNLRIAVDYLGEAGFQVLVAQGGESGLRRARNEQPDLILLDVLMPGMDGFEACRCLKEDESTRHIPVIFMTALADTEDKVKAFGMGAVDYIIKPIQRAELLARITTHLRIKSLTQELQRQNQRLQQQAAALQAAKEETELINRKLQRLVNLDGLTQVANRRNFDATLKREWKRLGREQSPLSLLLFDIDYFKRYNDHYGHQAGDACLQKIAQMVKNLLKRQGDLVARYGGEEFAIVLPGIGPEGAIHMAETIKQAIAQLEIEHAQSEVSPWVTLSIGVCSVIPHPEVQPENLIGWADSALYQAKHDGRDRYHFSSQHSLGGAIGLRMVESPTGFSTTQEESPTILVELPLDLASDLSCEPKSSEPRSCESKSCESKSCESKSCESKLEGNGSHAHKNSTVCEFALSPEI